jgi:hypothetical protein
MEDEWITTGNYILDTDLSDLYRKALKTQINSIYGISGESTLKPNSVTRKIYQANIVTVDGFTVKDRSGMSERSLPENYGKLKEVFWDPELGLLELSS